MAVTAQLSATFRVADIERCVAGSARPRGGRSDPLEQRRHALATACTHADDGVPTAGVVEVVDRGQRHPDPGGTGSMPQGQCATVEIGRLVRYSELPLHVEIDRRERLIDFPVVDVADGKPGPGEQR